MSDDVVVRAEGVGKRYFIETATVATESIAARRQRRKKKLIRTPSRTSSKELWALRGVDFEVRSGEKLGIVGSNGAGKSTLLKLLARITQPTEGAVEVTGRVGSMLEVGTGFHPELSGRENIFLNGSILGMKRAEIDRQFQRIVEFSELAELIDTPVKHYSSGMYVRLAFSVAAHLETEVLLMDEVLAVGDADFQQKCLQKFDEIVEQGRTILFVSHNLPVLRQLCPRALLLGHGQLLFDGPSDDAISRYLARGGLGGATRVDISEARRSKPRHPALQLRSIQLKSHGAAATILSDTDLTFEIGFEVFEPIDQLAFEFWVESADGRRLLDTRSSQSMPPFAFLPTGRHVIEGTVPNCPLAPGEYRVGVAALNSERRMDKVAPAMEFTVQEGRSYRSLWWERSTQSAIRLPGRWTAPSPRPGETR